MRLQQIHAPVLFPCRGACIHRGLALSSANMAFPKVDFYKGRSCLQKTAQRRNASMQNLGKGASSGRRARKGAYDRAARSHARADQDGRGARSVEVPKQNTKNLVRNCMAWKQRTLFLVVKEGHANRHGARPQRKHAELRQWRLLRGGGGLLWEHVTEQHAHMQAKTTAAAQGLLKFASITQKTNAGKVWLGSNASTIPADSPFARRGGSNVSGPGRSSLTQQAQQTNARRGASRAGSGKPQQAHARQGGAQACSHAKQANKRMPGNVQQRQTQGGEHQAKRRQR